MTNKIQNPNIKIHEKYMRIAIDLAKRAEGQTSPNPLVGAVVVKNGRVVGKGCHKKAGLPHAEVNAIKGAGNRAKGGTLYVTLEPCDHFGRTPPCTDTIIKSGIRKVVAAMTDPNPLTSGKGIKKLKRYGIMTNIGIMKKEAASINKPYIKYITKYMPYVTVKIAESLDGKIATRLGDSRWITSPDSRRYVHKLRGLVDAVMVGVNTVIRDDPMLTNRTKAFAKQPVRIVVDSGLKTPLDARVFSSKNDRADLLIATTRRSKKIERYEKKGAEVLVVKSKNGRVDLKELLKILAKRCFTHILVEGGGELTAGLLENHLVDKALFFIAPKIIGGRSAVTSVEGEGVARIKDALDLKNMKIRRFARDILIEGEIGA